MKARLSLSLALSLLIAGAPGPASAHHSPSAAKVGTKKPGFNEKRVSPRIQKALGGQVTAAPGGGYRVDMRRGPDVFTHGPDPVTPALSGGKAPRRDPFDNKFGSEPTRSPACVPPANANSDYYQHVIYMRPTGSLNRYTTVKADIQEEIQQMNYGLNRDSIASGGPTADYKVLCDGGGNIQVDHVVSGAAHTFNGVSSALRALGYNKQNVDYTIFYDGDPAVAQCGVGGFYPNNEQLDVNNPNNLGNNHGITWVDCWDGLTPQHENGHNQGAVGYNAPSSTGDGAHCFQAQDVMCYNDGGDLDPGPPLSACGTPAPANETGRFDCGFDTYFDSAVEFDEPYLDNHWNIGSELNRFIAFGSGGGNQPPTAAFTWDCPDLTCQFTDNSIDSDGSIDTRSWNFGDGGLSSAQQNPSHTYPDSGTYNVSLLVTDGDGDSDFVEAPISVSDGTVPRLVSGVPVNAAAGPQGGFDRFKIRVPRKAQKITIKTSGEPCGFVSEEICLPDLDLYVAIGFPPDLEDFHCRPFRYGITETCVGRRPGIRGIHQIAVHNFAAAPGTPFRIRATIKR